MNGIVAKSMMWNLWHGCHKLSAGCKHCYVYRGDARREVDSSVVVRTKNFDLPLRKSVTENSRYHLEHLSTPVLLPISLWKMLTNGGPKHGR